MKKIAIILNGARPKGRALFAVKSLKYDMVIAADGGWDFCAENDIIADYVIGDFDSARIRPASDKTKIIEFPKDKNATDGELACDFAISQGAGVVDIYGGGGRRIDHLLGNLNLLLRLTKAGVSARMINNGSIVYLTSGSLDLGKMGRATLSLIPLGGEATVDITGVKYPLKDKVLKTDNTLGISNEARGEVSIRVSDGYALVIVNSLRHISF